MAKVYVAGLVRFTYLRPREYRDAIKKFLGTKETELAGALKQLADLSADEDPSDQQQAWMRQQINAAVVQWKSTYAMLVVFGALSVIGIWYRFECHLNSARPQIANRVQRLPRRA